MIPTIATLVDDASLSNDRPCPPNGGPCPSKDRHASLAVAPPAGSRTPRHQPVRAFDPEPEVHARG